MLVENQHDELNPIRWKPKSGNYSVGGGQIHKLDTSGQGLPQEPSASGTEICVWRGL